jgi:hypothetical protein
LLKQQTLEQVRQLLELSRQQPVLPPADDDGTSAPEPTEPAPSAAVLVQSAATTASPEGGVEGATVIDIDAALSFD